MITFIATLIAILIVTLILIVLLSLWIVITTIIYRLWKYNWSHPLNQYTDWIYKTNNPLLRSRIVRVNEGFGTYLKTIYWFEKRSGYSISPTEMYNIYLNVKK